MAEKTRPKMPISHRAKQFAPFAALKGFEDAIKEKEQIFEPQVELSEEMADELDFMLSQLKKGKKITATYYCDGKYIEYTGLFEKIDLISKVLFIDDTNIPIEDISNITLL